jgi:hypothetical protein
MIWAGAARGLREMDQPHAPATHAEPSVDSEHRSYRIGTDCRPRRQLEIELARSVHEQQREPEDGGEKTDKCGERKQRSTMSIGNALALSGHIQA